MPMTLAAPGRFSDTTVCPSWRPTWSITIRAVTSSALPGVLEMMTWIGSFVGQSCAKAAPRAANIAIIPSRRALRIIFLHFFQGITAHCFDERAGSGRAFVGTVHEGKLHFGRRSRSYLFINYIWHMTICHSWGNRRDPVAERDIAQHCGEVFGTLDDLWREAAHRGDCFDVACESEIVADRS